MFLRNVKLVITAAAVIAGLAAGAVSLAQSESGRSKDGTGKPQHAGSSNWTYHILVSRKGEPPRKVAVVELTGDKPVRVDAPGALILFQPKRDGESDRPTAAEGHDQEHRKIVLTSLKAMDVDITQPFVCQIHSLRHIDVRALGNGYLKQRKVGEGQAVKKGDLMFKIVPSLDKAKPDAESANVRAPFDGIVGRLNEQLGSPIKEGDILTTLLDNSVMWVFFNVPEKVYLEYRANQRQHEREDRIELMLADQSIFPQPGKISAIAAEFNDKTGNIAFRADFLNPDGLLRHGQTGTILIHRKLHNATVIPQRAIFDILDKRYV